MKQIIQIFNFIYWSLYKLTPRGKQAYVFKKSIEGFAKTKKEQNITKWSAIQTAKKLLRPKKILAFDRGVSITKSKKSTHEVIQKVKNDHKDDLDEKHLTINRKGKFKHA